MLDWKRKRQRRRRFHKLFTLLNIESHTHWIANIGLEAKYDATRSVLNKYSLTKTMMGVINRVLDAGMGSKG